MITAFIKENVIAALLVFTIVIFVWYFVDERKHYRSIFTNIDNQTEEIHKVILFIEDKVQRTEEKVNMLSQESNEVSKAFIQVKSMLEKIELIINQKIQK